MVFIVIASLHVKPEHVGEVKAKLQEAAQIYRQDKEDHKDETKFCIVERYEQESSVQIHRANPYYATFGPYVAPRLAEPMSLTRWEEL